jgi:predicted ATPase
LFHAHGRPDRQRHRVHFHAFMLDVHQRLHQLRQVGAPSGTLEPLHHVADALVADHGHVWCFDVRAV